LQNLRGVSGSWKLGFWSEEKEGQPKIAALQSITQIEKHFRGEKKTNAQPLPTKESFIKEPSKSVIRGVCIIVAAIYYGFWKTRRKPPSLALVVINPKPIVFLSRCLSTSRLALWLVMMTMTIFFPIAKTFVVVQNSSTSDLVHQRHSCRSKKKMWRRWWSGLDRLTLIKKWVIDRERDGNRCC
jgi:uncharacterized membrane protein